METIYLPFYSSFRPFWDRYQDELRDVLLLMRKLLSTKGKESTATLPLSQRREVILNQDICSHLKGIVAIERVYYFFSLFRQTPFSVLRLQSLITAATEFFNQNDKTYINLD